MNLGRVLVLLLLPGAAALADFEWRAENSNFTLSQASLDPQENERYLYNYNRFRVRTDWKQSAFFVTAIGDVVNYLGSDYIDSVSVGYIRQLHSDTTFDTQTAFNDYSNGTVYARLYRLYGGYDDGKNRIVAGLQNITMGVGYIWTPSNLFNPINTYALEPDETYGVAALTASHYFNGHTQIYAAVSQKEDKSYRYAAGAKTTIGIVDVALNAIKSDETKMLGYTIQSDLGDTGIELRSEGAWIEAVLQTMTGAEEKRFFQGIIGADYAFHAGLNLTVEALYSSETFSYDEILRNFQSELRADLVMSHFYLGTTMRYDFTIYLSGSLLYIESFSDTNSRFVSPTLTYTLNDNNTFILGAMIQGGPSQSEFGMFGNTYYLKYTLSF
jgi:hypothetical protein